MQALDEFQLRADADLAALLHDELLDVRRSLRAAEGARGRARLPRPAAARARSGARQRRGAAALPGALHAPLRRRVPGHRSAAGRAAAAAGRRRSGRDALAARRSQCPASCSSSAIRSSRSTGSAAPTCDIYRRVCELLVERGATLVELRKSFRSVAEHPACRQRRVRAGDGRRRETLQARYVPLEPSRDDHAGPAVGRRAAGAASRTRSGSSPARAIEQSLPDAVGAYVDWLVRQSGWTVTERRDPATPRAARGAARLHPVPPLRQLRRGHHARLRRRARGARHPAPAGRRHGVPRPRGDRDAARRADGDRVAGRPAVGVRHAARRAVRDRRRRAARVSPHRRRAFIRSGFRQTLPERPRAGSRGAGAAGATASPPQPSAGGRHDLRRCSAARARTSASCCAPAASRRWPTCCTSPSWRASTSSTAACRSAASSKRCAKPRRAVRPPRRRSSRRAATAFA